MPKPSEILATSAAFLNDPSQGMFTNVKMLPYFNQALRDLQEKYELYDIPITHETTDVISVPAGSVGITSIGFIGPGPKLPRNLIELKQVWESPSGQETWTRMSPRDFLSQQQLNSQIPQFLVYTWEDDELKVFTATQDNDIKLDYVKSLFSSVVDVSMELGVKFDKCYSYLAYRTASLSAFYIGENPTRALALNSDAEKAMDSALGVAIKGQQKIPTRRLPFRFGFKNIKRSFRI